jgi:hypothetical protein
VKGLLFLLLTSFLLISPAQAVIIDGKDWRQVTDTVNLSHNDLNSIYDISTGNLDTAVTSIGGVDFAGWVWATEAEVAAMLSTFGSINLVANGGFAQFNSSSIASIFDVFDYTFSGTTIPQDGAFQALRGMTRDLGTDAKAQYTWVLDYLAPSLDGIINQSNYTISTGTASTGYGHFMYRTPTIVSEPSAILLFGLGIMSMLGFRKQ